MECRDCLENLDSYVDRELSDAEIERVRHHLADCPPCEDLYSLQVSMKKLVKVCCDQGEAPSYLREKLNQILY